MPPALAGVTTTEGLRQLALLVLAGLPIAPLQSLGGLHLDRFAGARASESFGLVATAMTLGAGLGQVIASQATARLTPGQLVILATAPPALAALLVAVGQLRRARSSRCR